MKKEKISNKKISKSKRRNLKVSEDTTVVICYGDSVFDNGKLNSIRSFKNFYNKYLSKFPYIYSLELEDLHLLKYNKGNYYQAHADYSSSTPRNLSVIVNLNEGYSGGTLNFYDPQSFETRQKYSLKEGDSIIFPSNFLFPHSIDTIEKGTRYSIVAWLK